MTFGAYPQDKRTFDGLSAEQSHNIEDGRYLERACCPTSGSSLYSVSPQSQSYGTPSACHLTINSNTTWYASRTRCFLATALAAVACLNPRRCSRPFQWPGRAEPKLPPFSLAILKPRFVRSAISRASSSVDSGAKLDHHFTLVRRIGAHELDLLLHQTRDKVILRPSRSSFPITSVALCI